MATLGSKTSIKPEYGPNVHTKESYAFGFSLLFHALCYYGIRAIFVLVLLDKSIYTKRSEAIDLLQWLFLAMLIAKIISALLGDLVFNNRKMYVFGGIVQTIGILLCFYPDSTFTITGLIAFFAGSSLVALNLRSSFAKLYLNKKHALDSAFTLYHLMVNWGSFLGAFVFTVVYEIGGLKNALIIAAISSVLAVVLSIIVSPKQVVIEDTFVLEKKSGESWMMKYRVVLLLFFIVGIYYLASIFGYWAIDEVERAVVQWNYNFVAIELYLSWGMIALTITSIIFIYKWSRNPRSHFSKLFMGILFMILAFSLCYILDFAQVNHFIPAMIVTTLMTISTIYVSVIVDTILVERLNPKYLTIAMGLNLLPYLSVSYWVILVYDGTDLQTYNGLLIIILFLVILAIALGFYVFKPKAVGKSTNDVKWP